MLLPAVLAAAEGPPLKLPHVILSKVPFDVKIIPAGSTPTDSVPYSLHVGPRPLTTGAGGPSTGMDYKGIITSGGGVTLKDLHLSWQGGAFFSLQVGEEEVQVERDVLPGWISLLPPIIAIVLAIAFREVVFSLFLGIWLGASFLYGLNPLTGFLRSLDTIVVGVLTERSHVEIILFSLMLGGMIGLITRNGGTAGIIEKLKTISTSVLRGQVATWAMGVFIFFDDYANTLIVGNTMRPITDRLKISREKLSYIVDATAAPVSSVAIISTWIGFEVGLISDAIEPLKTGIDPYLLFLQTIPHRFYPLLSIFFVLLVAITGRDFGPMLKAERRSRVSGKLLRDGAVPLSNFETDGPPSQEGLPLRWINAVVPILVVILGTIFGLWIDGRHVLLSMGRDPASLPLREVITQANTFNVLLWASTFGVLSAMGLTYTQRIMSISRMFDAWVSGIRSMLLAMIVLVLAWSIGNVCDKLSTANYVVFISRGIFSPRLLPALTFIISALISFSTGTSWATMAIVIPIVAPLSHNLCLSASFPAAEVQMNMVSTLSGVLAGSIFGDHCSPISDTTIMSSMASSADHVDHVRTQLPYAVLVAIVGLLVGDLPSGYGLSPYWSLLIGCIVLAAFLWIFGGRVETNENGERPA